MSAPASTAWTAFWIDDGEQQNGRDVLLFFRRVFWVGDPEEWRELRISADSIYRLWLNGIPIARGPERWSVDHRVFDTHDLSAHVRPNGENVIAVEVLCWGAAGPTFDVSARPALIVEAPELRSDSNFRVRRFEGFNPDGAPEFPRVVHVAGNWMESRDARLEDAEWRALEYDDSEWRAARELVQAEDPEAPWRLFPRGLPAAEVRKAEQLNAIQRGVVVAAPAAPPFGYAIHATSEAGTAPFEFPGDGQTHYLVFDARRIVTAFLELELQAPAGATIELMYAESPRMNFVKGHRDQLEGQRVEGYTDIFVAREGRQSYEPQIHRTFRYVRLAVRTPGPLIIYGLRSAWTGFPFTQRGAFSCSDEVLTRIWQVGWDTCRLCAHDTYEDTPHYEQLQYTGDMRIQALISYWVAGESRLAEKALRQLAENHASGAFLPSRYPSREIQVIPGYSLLWIEMLEEFQLHTGLDELARELLPVVDDLLATFKTHEDSLGCLRELPMWNFLDWSYPDKGVPHLFGDVCAPITMFYVGALSAAARLHARLGNADRASEYDARSRRTGQIVAKQTYSAREELFRDGVVQRGFSMHTNALAILYGLIEGDGANRLADRLFSDKRLRPSSFYFDFYVHRALERIGRSDLLLADLSRWKDMLDLGATAWFELINGERSDCHAWSASPTLDLLTTVLGVRVTAPGFREVRIEPHTGGLEWAQGRVATPMGEIEVRWENRGELKLEVELPPGVRGTIVHPDGTEQIC